MTHEFKLPTGLASGEYLLRSEMLALHGAQTVGGAQFYSKFSRISFILSLMLINSSRLCPAQDHWYRQQGCLRSHHLPPRCLQGRGRQHLHPQCLQRL
jgi:hypothetical protein